MLSTKLGRSPNGIADGSASAPDASAPDVSAPATAEVSAPDVEIPEPSGPSTAEISDPEASEPAGFSVAKGRKRQRRRRSRFKLIRGWLQERSSTPLAILLTLAIFASLLAVGTVHVTTLIAIAPLVLIAGAFAAFVEDDTKALRRPPALVALVLSLYSFLQSLPLSPKLLEAISPTALQIWRDAFHLAAESPNHWASISLDPGASRVEALKWLCYAATFVAAARLARERGSKHGAAIVVSAAVVAGLISIAHGLLNLDAWLGIYKPQYARPPWALSPLLNANNFAGYLNLALFSGVGLLFLRKPPTARWIIGFGIALMAALVVLSASRGGVLALVVGFGISGIAYHRQQREAKRRGGFLFPTWLPLAGVGVAAATLALIGATDLIWQELRDETLEKLRVLDYSRPLIQNFFWTGVGRGAFETVFPAYRQFPGHVIAPYAENFVVQWFVEWGVPISALTLITLGWAMRPKRFGFARNSVPTGIYVGIAVLLLQNLVDLATEVASVGLAIALLLGTLSGGADYLLSQREAERAKRRRETLPESKTPARWEAIAVNAAAGSLFVGIAMTIAAAMSGRPDAIDERWQLAEHMQSVMRDKEGNVEVANERTELKLALLRHPADPYIPLIGAILSQWAKEPALPWLNHALRRDPMSAQPHLLLADILAARGVMNQAMFELSKACQLGPELVNAVADRATRWSKNTEQLLRAVPSGEQGIPLLNAIAQRIPLTRDATDLHSELLALSLQRNPQDVNTNAIYADELLASLDSTGPGCEGVKRQDCEKRLQKHANAVANGSQHSQIAVVLKGKLLAREAKFDEAERWLAEECPQLSTPSVCNSDRVSYAMKLADPLRLDAAIANFTATACTTSQACSDAFAWLGDLEAQIGNWRAALARYERSAQENPTSDAWMRVVDTALRVGRIGRAETALATAIRLSDAKARPTIEAKSKELQRIRLVRVLEEPTGKP